MSKVETFDKAELVGSYLREYVGLREQEKRISDRKAVLAEYLKLYAQENGVEDDKGSYYCEHDNFIFGRQSRKSVKLDDVKAVKFLKNNGFENAVKIVEMVDQDELTRLIDVGDIKMSDVESFTVINETFSIDVRERKKGTQDDTIVGISEVKPAIAASAKKSLKFKRAV